MTFWMRMMISVYLGKKITKRKLKWLYKHEQTRLQFKKSLLPYYCKMTQGKLSRRYLILDLYILNIFPNALG